MDNLKFVIITSVIFNQFMIIELTLTKFRHKNTLLDVLAPNRRLYDQGESKHRIVKRGKSHADIAEISQGSVIQLVMQAFLNILIATLHQGRTPLKPSFPKSMIQDWKSIIEN